MQVQLTSTTKIVMLITEQGSVPARVWEGVTANGIPCRAYIPRIAVAREEDCAEFDQDLLEQAQPSPATAELPMLLVL